jgi:tetratricopeptide (TPR) repeat protein
MKRISLFVATLLIIAGGLFAQDPSASGNSALNYTGLENKLKKSEADIQDAKKNIKAKTWTSRAALLVDIYNVNNDVLRKGMDAASVKLFYKEPKEVQTSQDGPDKVEVYVYDRVNLTFRNGLLESWKETVAITEDPINKAITAINEAVKLNVDGKASGDITDAVKSLKMAIETEAVAQYESKDFKSSYANFIKLLDLNNIPQLKGQIDTVYMYYAGRAALEGNDFNNAVKMFDQASANKYEDPFLYVFRKQAYFGVGDTVKGLSVIEEGFTKYPDNASIMIELINYYLVANQGESALKLLAKAKATDPTNVSYTFAEGTLYDKMGNFEEAEKAYKTCIEMNPKFFDASYNLGVLYFNKAVKIYEDASKISDNTEFEKVQKQGDEMLLNAVPYMEKAHELDAADRSSLETLKTIFYRLKMDDKYQAVVKEINSL